MDISYFQKLREEAFELWKQAEDIKIWEEFDSMKPDKILYEKVPKRVRFVPMLGRYDRFFYPYHILGQPYRPSKKLYTELPLCDNEVIAYLYQEGKPTFVTTVKHPPETGYYHPIGCSLGNLDLFFDQDEIKGKEWLTSVQRIQLLGDKTEYVRLCDDCLSITQYLVAEGGKSCDIYEIDVGTCFHEYCELVCGEETYWKYTYDRHLRLIDREEEMKRYYKAHGIEEKYWQIKEQSAWDDE